MYPAVSERFQEGRKSAPDTHELLAHGLDGKYALHSIKKSGHHTLMLFAGSEAKAPIAYRSAAIWGRAQR